MILQEAGMILQEGVNCGPENFGHARDEIDGAFLFDDRRDLRLLAKTNAQTRPCAKVKQKPLMQILKGTGSALLAKG